jgi:GNAT superfamily N-acetyltransferase
MVNLMKDEYQVVFVEHPEQSAWGIIGTGLNDFNKKQAGDDKPQRLCFVIQSAGEEIAGGVIGVVYWDWLYIDLMWVKEDLRGKGYGHRLLAQIEEAARNRGAKHVHLDTFSFQAPDFYRKHGYREFGRLDDFPAGHTRYFFVKHF